MRGRRQRHLRLPRAHRIVVAVRDKRADTRIGRAKQFARKFQLRRQTVVRRVIYVTGDHNRGDAFFNRRIDDVAERLKSRVAQCFFPIP